MSERNARAMRNAALLMLAALMLLLIMCGCAPAVRYVPVESVRTEYLTADTTGIYEHLRAHWESEYHKENAADSLIERWKETLTLNEKGDTTRHDTEHTVYVSSRREVELERKLKQSDSIIKALQTRLASVKADSIPVPYPVERPLSRWERVKMDFGGMAIGALAISLCTAIIWLIKKLRK